MSGRDEDIQGVFPGIHPTVELGHFTPDERKIIERIAKEWFVTNGGEEIRLTAGSIYRHLLIKPTKAFSEMFNIEREIVLLFTPYESFEPRTIDAITIAASRFATLRVDRICCIVVSRDLNIEDRLRDVLSNDKEAQIVVPFTYEEFLANQIDSYTMRNRFIKYFYARDLFAFESPIQKDLYFFGRTDLVHSLISRHKAQQVSGLFGLRKSGKTSVIYGIKRAIKRSNGAAASIDCQSPAFHKLRWNEALHSVLNDVRIQLELDVRLESLERYTETNAPLLFEKHMERMASAAGNQSIMLIFDEIENITPLVSPTAHWKEGSDFVFFWQTLRSIFQKKPNLFSYLLVGTNPLCVELPRIGGIDNPIFGQVPLDYIQGFDVGQVREMVRRLGRIMGLQFDETIYSRLAEDLGGHPYLVRHVCSTIHNLAGTNRPVRVDKTLYTTALRKFAGSYSHFLEMVIGVLLQYFPDEFEMLTLLALNDTATFNEFAQANNLYTNHLLGYGLLQESDGRYSFKIDLIKEYLAEKLKHKRVSMSDTERWAEISERRNKVEIGLRKLCRMQLQAAFGEADARQKVLDIFGDPRKSKFANLKLAELFDPRLSEIYLSDLTKLFRKHWDSFKHILGVNQEEVISGLELINRLRGDAHAKALTDAEFALFRVVSERLENVLNGFWGGGG